ncbi:Hemin-binding periplasmic protein HmuT precursor [Symmachiella dynata]|nr:Hemin-binding periplasmic protein HmuT precursor [Symmachiella dynata]
MLSFVLSNKQKMIPHQTPSDNLIMPEHRIISLIASATEIVAALGCKNRLVGRSHECDYPPAVEQLPACSEAKLDVNGTSRQIDDRVKAILRDAVSVYRVFPEMLEELQPSVVITQTQCEVCAVSLKDVEAAVCEMVSSQPNIVALEPNWLKDVWSDIRAVATAIDVPQQGEELIATAQQRLADLESRTTSLPHKPTIACIEWIDPLMAAGNWVPELVTIAGGTNLFGKAGEHSPWMTWEELFQADPEVIAILPCGFDIPRAREEMSVLTDKPQWPQLQAVQNGRVYVTDGNQYFNRPGPRLVESAEIFAEILHPDTFDFGHADSGWVLL